VSSVTDLVMILPTLWQASDRWVLKGRQAIRDQFEDLFEEMQGWRPIAVTESPYSPKGWSSDVYVAGVNYFNWDIPEAVQKLDWPPGTVLYLCHENGSPMVLQLGGSSGPG
jgi:hypothetical protein